MLHEPWSLVVRTKSPEALPKVPWWHPISDPVPTLFGYRCAYYNPNHREHCPVTILEACVAIYGMEQPDGQTFVCEVGREHIVSVLLLPMTPGKVAELYQRDGWSGLSRAAARRHEINRTAEAIAA